MGELDSTGSGQGKYAETRGNTRLWLRVTFPLETETGDSSGDLMQGRGKLKILKLPFFFTARFTEKIRCHRYRKL